MTLAIGAAGFCFLATALHLVSVTIVAIRCRSRGTYRLPPGDAPRVTVVRPLCGVENFIGETLRSTFKLDYPRYEIIFCLERSDDPVASIARKLIEEHPQTPARLLIGADSTSPNPKLNNVIKGWDAARDDWIILADSNVLMPPDYIQRLLATWRGDTGLVCSMPIASSPTGFWAELECAFLNTYQARWQLAADALGFGFAQGKSMLFRRDIVERGGGMRALGAEMAEDAATTKLVRSAGLRVRVVDHPFAQPLGCRSAPDVWMRQLRWARLRRMTFPLCFLPELFVGCAFPVLAGAYAATSVGLGAASVCALLLAGWFAAEAALARVAGWHLSWRMLPAFLVRDLLLPVLWVDAWIGDDMIWRGTTISPQFKADEPAEKTAGQPAG
jgi:ceramide glucosyltransferase